MRLWTWQKPGVSLTDGEYDNLKYSDYVNDSCIVTSERDRFREAYRKIWKLLGKNENETIKILWCYTEEKDAKNQERLSNQNKVLWGIDVPEQYIQYCCSVAWHWILYGRDGSGCEPPEKFLKFYRKFNRQFHRNKFYKDFNSGWRTMPENALWDILFLDNLVEGCSTAIVIHPVKEDWVIEKSNFSEM